jgi:hypothetical protein
LGQGYGRRRAEGGVVGCQDIELEASRHGDAQGERGGPPRGRRGAACRKERLRVVLSDDAAAGLSPREEVAGAGDRACRRGVAQEIEVLEAPPAVRQERHRRRSSGNRGKPWDGATVNWRRVGACASPTRSNEEAQPAQHRDRPDRHPLQQPRFSPPFHQDCSPPRRARKRACQED